MHSELYVGFLFWSVGWRQKTSMSISCRKVLLPSQLTILWMLMNFSQNVARFKALWLLFVGHNWKIKRTWIIVIHYGEWEKVFGGKFYLFQDNLVMCLETFFSRCEACGQAQCRLFETLHWSKVAVTGKWSSLKKVKYGRNKSGVKHKPPGPEVSGLLLHVQGLPIYRTLLLLWITGS